jgi:DNA-directed RNA polymerase subunit N (RpoN/RPB10)
MNIRWLIINIIWTIVYLVACFSAGWIIRPMFDRWKKKIKEQKISCSDNSNDSNNSNNNNKLMEVSKNEKVV